MSRAVLLQACARSLALCCVASLVACTDSLRPDATGSIALHIVTADQPAASTVGTRAAAMTQGHLEAATATASNGTTTKTVNLTGGTGSSNFTGTITGLPVGTYTVTVEGLVGGQVDYFGQTSGVSVQANTTSNANVSWGSFIPATVTAGTSPTWSFSPTVSFTAVPSATSYVIEADLSSGFNSPALTSTTVTGTSGYVQVPDTGTWYIRVRAANPTVTGGGRPSTPVTEAVVTDLRPSGMDFSTADSLGGYGSLGSLTLDSLNIYPAGQLDWFALSECNGDSVTVTAQAVRLSPPSPLNSALAVFSGSTGRLVAASDNADSTDARVRLALKSDGTYKVAVAGAQNTVGHYKLAIQVTAGPNQLPGGCNVTPLPGVTSVASGAYHTCIIRSGGVTDCWGLNEAGQLGVSPTTAGASSSPIQVSGGYSFTSVVAGGEHTCALDGSGNAYCWGANGNGQLGDGTTTNRSTPTAVTGYTFAALTAGDAFTCGIEYATNAAYCWGWNGAGQLGDGTNTQRGSPTLVTGGKTFMSLEAGSHHVCGVDLSGAMYCWGENGQGELGDNSYNDSNIPVAVQGAIVFQTAAVGGFHSCGLASGVAYCWGGNTWGALGDGTTTDSPTPVLVSGSHTFASLSGGRYSTCGITTTPETYCWGDNFDGQVGDGTTTDYSSPTLLGMTFQTISAGGFHTCGADASNNAYCWGWNGFGQTGDGSAFEHAGPVPVDASSLGGGVTGISTGHQHTCAVSATGDAYCWGWNQDGQLGDGTYTDNSTPVAVYPVGDTYQTISAGAYATCGLTTNGFVYCWGDNTDGELGDGTYTSSNLPQGVSGSWGALSMGDNHACVLDSNGYAACWGDNSSGQLGIGSYATSNAPASVSPPSGGSTLTFQQISGGSNFTCGVTTAGDGYCWGDDTYGELGDGTTSTSPIPVLVAGGFTWAYVQAGFNFACGLTTSNEIYCWGANGDGQLGTGDYNFTGVPTLVSGGRSWKALSVSRNNDACGITMSDVLYCWGDNFFGNLGDNTFVTSNTPVLVLAAATFSAVSAGDVHTCGISSSGKAYCWGNDERGELGYGMLTIHTTPGTVLYGPASTPARTAGLGAPGGAAPRGVREPDRSGSAAGAKVRAPRRVSGLRLQR